jgi:uncharacterized membrane protein
MESLFILLGLLLLAIPLIAIVALTRTITLGEHFRRLDARLAAIERGTAAAIRDEAVPAAEPRPAPPPIPPTMEEVPQAAVPPTPEPPARAPIAAPRPAPGAAAPMSLEQRLGTQWTVWVGGLALALGGIFLVRYSIEQGLLGPRVRLALAALLATALIISGEWARRTQRLAHIASLPRANIPSILIAAGTTVAYADVYAAHALYQFLAPGPAFLLLGVVAIATLAAALLHGPALAGLGLVGAYVTPLLVASERPDYWSLYIYLAVVTAAAFALARLRLWRWLAIAAITCSLAWTLPGVGVVSVEALPAHVFHVLAGFALATTFIVAGFLLGPDADVGRIDPVSSAALKRLPAGGDMPGFGEPT